MKALLLVLLDAEARTALFAQAHVHADREDFDKEQDRHEGGHETRGECASPPTMGACTTYNTAS